MSSRLPPNPNVSTFNPAYWFNPENALTATEADLLYLKFPVSQSATENFVGPVVFNSSATFIAPVIAVDATISDTLSIGTISLIGSNINLLNATQTTIGTGIANANLNIRAGTNGTLGLFGGTNSLYMDSNNGLTFSGGNLNLTNATQTTIGSTVTASNLNIRGGNTGSLLLSAGGKNITVNTNGLTINNPITSTNITTPVSGQLGYINNFSFASFVVLNTGQTGTAATTIQTCSIPAGTWIIKCNFVFSTSASTTISLFQAEISTTAATLNQSYSKIVYSGTGTSILLAQTITQDTTLYVSVAAATDYYMVANATFTTGSVSCSSRVQTIRIA
jgi:hypothetical protein